MAEEATAITGIRSWVDADFFTEFWYHDENKLRKALDVLRAELKKRGGKINLTDIQLKPNILLTVQAAAGSLISNEFSVNMLDALEAVLSREGVDQDAHVLTEAVLKALNNNVDLMNSGWRKPLNEFGEKLEETGFAENAYDVSILAGMGLASELGKKGYYAPESYENDAAIKGKGSGINTDSAANKGGLKTDIEFSNMSEAEIAKIANEYRSRAPIKIPENATYQAKSMKDGYEQITYKWSNGTYKYESRWHTRTSKAPIEQGDTWVIQRKTPGKGSTQPTSDFLIGNDEWVPGYKWFEAIKARKAGNATTEQIRILEKGHWKEKL